MGQIVVERVLAKGHDVVAFDLDPEAVATAAERGAEAAEDPVDVLDRLGDERRVWLMVPAGEAVDATLDELAPHLTADDVVVDGGNSHFEASVRQIGRAHV